MNKYEANKIVPMLNAIKPGQRVKYYEGYLVRDIHDTHIGNPEAHSNLTDIRDAAWRLYENDRAVLAQKHVEDGVYQYYAIGREAQ